MANVNKVIIVGGMIERSCRYLPSGEFIEGLVATSLRRRLPDFADYTTSITNDMPDAGGGGASAEGVTTDAPAAAGDDDDGGDGDGDPDPERLHHPSPSLSSPSLSFPSPSGHHRNVTATADGLLWSMPTLVANVGICRAGIYQRIQAGNFPPPLKIGRSSRWLASEIHAWVHAHACARSPKTAG